MSLPHLFAPLGIRAVSFRNRIGVSPMCQYSSTEGLANDWHLVHLGSRAVGGAGLVLTEAAAVDPRGRISPSDLGIWDDRQVPGLQRVASFIRAHGAVAGIQLAHAGRKASTSPPWEGGRAVPSGLGGWQPVAPSADAFDANSPVPDALDRDGILDVIASFRQAAARAGAAGFQVVEIHAAHGYLIHEFLSPLTNHRTDEFGGSYDNRTRLLKQVCKAVRDVWPADLPLFVRVSSTDWAEGGWRAEDTVALAHHLSSVGVDLVDCSSGGIAPGIAIPSGPGYQVPFSQRIKDTTPMLTAAVGVITSPAQADQIIRNEQADLILLGREMLRDPYWPLRAARALGQDAAWPNQYLRAK
ncbi:MAG: NADH:flavin oxidoreductase/NADH oxidase [Vicinamibacterales bacterium]|nr:NADH:flavin oxidoreductase/NADH oxidase [Vicinamibacterales bacterium]